MTDPWWSWSTMQSKITFNLYFQLLLTLSHFKYKQFRNSFEFYFISRQMLVKLFVSNRTIEEACAVNTFKNFLKQFVYIYTLYSTLQFCCGEQTIWELTIFLEGQICGNNLPGRRRVTVEDSGIRKALFL